KTLVETAPADWLPVLDLPPAPVAVIDADIAAVIAGAADKVLRVRADPEYLLHLDFEAGTTPPVCPGACGCIIPSWTIGRMCWCGACWSCCPRRQIRRS